MDAVFRRGEILSTKNFLVQDTLSGSSIPKRRNIVNKKLSRSGYIEWKQYSEEAKHCQHSGYIKWTLYSEEAKHCQQNFFVQDTLIGRSVLKRRNIANKKLSLFRIH